MDQHLFAEFREIKMISPSLRRSIISSTRSRIQSHQVYQLDHLTKCVIADVLGKIPKQFTLNQGHVSFFYDKGNYLRHRYQLIKQELRRRGVNFNDDVGFDQHGLFGHAAFNNDYAPTMNDISIIRERIAAKIAMKPMWYRYKGQPINQC